MTSSSSVNVVAFDHHHTTEHTSAGPTPLVARNKRRNTALSCAECRRLKLRCNRVWPCTNCVKKGCGVLCPDDSLTTGKGNRFVLANTETLHEKIEELSNRVRQLEDALAASHRNISNEQHPLLSEDLLQIKRPLEREKPDAVKVKEEKPESVDAIDAMGSLSISERGRTSFFGQTANSYYLLTNEEASEEEDNTRESVDSPTGSVDWLSYGFPLISAPGQSHQKIRNHLFSLLPNILVAQRFSESYFKHAAWMYTPIPELDFQQIFQQIYDPGIGAQEGRVDAHALSVLYLVIAIGTLLDPEMPAYSSEASHYYQLGRVALALKSVLEEQSVMAIRALLLMCHYMFLSGIEGPRWVIMGLVVKLAHSVGLHRDSRKWNLNMEDSQQRRALMWEIYTYDSWQSLTYGRPPSFTLHHIDCGMAHETTKTATGQVEMSFNAWKHRFSSQVLSVVHDHAFGARSPSYKTLINLDKQVREFYVPPSLQVEGFGSAAGSINGAVEMGGAPPSLELTMQRYIGHAIREITLFYMHRGFFARALEENPVDPLANKYGSSVLAAYNSATSFVTLIKSLYKQYPILTERMWFLFTHVFSCAIVLGSIAVKTKMKVASSALSYLDAARQLFEAVSHNSRAAKVLPILVKLQERACATMTPHPAVDHHVHHSNSLPVKMEADELSALGGGTRLVPRRAATSPSSPSSPNSRSSASPAATHSHPPSSPSRQSSYPLTPTSHSQNLQPFVAPESPWAEFGHMHDFEGVNGRMTPGGAGPYSPQAVPLDQEFAQAYSQVPNALLIQQQQQQQQHQQQHQQYPHSPIDPQQHLPHHNHNMQPQSPDGMMNLSQFYYLNAYPDLTTLSGVVDGPHQLAYQNDLGASWQNLIEQFKV